MKEGLLRHALTASLAALLASLGTAALIGDNSATSAGSSAAPPQRPDPRDDAALIEAISEVRRAVDGVRASVELASAKERRRLVDVTDDGPEGAASEDSSGAAAARSRGVPEERWAAPTSVPGRRVNVTAVQDYLSRISEFEALEGRDSRDHPDRDYYLRSFRDVLAEFGHPTRVTGSAGGIRCWWDTPSGTITAQFMDGYCVRIFD